jgi:hypothetical protein
MSLANDHQPTLSSVSSLSSSPSTSLLDQLNGNNPSSNTNMSMTNNSTNNNNTFSIPFKPMLTSKAALDSTTSSSIQHHANLTMLSPAIPMTSQFPSPLIQQSHMFTSGVSIPSPYQTPIMQNANPFSPSPIQSMIPPQTPLQQLLAATSLLQQQQQQQQQDLNASSSSLITNSVSTPPNSFSTGASMNAAMSFGSPQVAMATPPQLLAAAASVNAANAIISSASSLSSTSSVPAAFTAAFASPAHILTQIHPQANVPAAATASIPGNSPHVAISNINNSLTAILNTPLQPQTTFAPFTPRMSPSITPSLLAASTHPLTRYNSHPNTVQATMTPMTNVVNDMFKEPQNLSMTLDELQMNMKSSNSATSTAGMMTMMMGGSEASAIGTRDMGGVIASNFPGSTQGYVSSTSAAGTRMIAATSAFTTKNDYVNMEQLLEGDDAYVESPKPAAPTSQMGGETYDYNNLNSTYNSPPSLSTLFTTRLPTTTNTNTSDISYQANPYSFQTSIHNQPVFQQQHQQEQTHHLQHPPTPETTYIPIAPIQKCIDTIGSSPAVTYTNTSTTFHQHPHVTHPQPYIYAYDSHRQNDLTPPTTSSDSHIPYRQEASQDPLASQPATSTSTTSTSVTSAFAVPFTASSASQQLEQSEEMQQRIKVKKPVIRKKRKTKTQLKAEAEERAIAYAIQQAELEVNAKMAAAGTASLASKITKFSPATDATSLQTASNSTTQDPTTTAVVPPPLHLDRKHPCDICHKRFRSISNLRDHRRNHQRTRTHHCDQPDCNKSFFRKQDLFRHQATHLGDGERPFECRHEGCGKRFGRLDAMQRHAALNCVKRVVGNGDGDGDGGESLSRLGGDGEETSEVGDVDVDGGELEA